MAALVPRLAAGWRLSAGWRSLAASAAARGPSCCCCRHVGSSQLVVAKLLRVRVVDIAEALKGGPGVAGLEGLRVFSAGQLADPGQRSAFLEALSAGKQERLIVLPKAAAAEVFGTSLAPLAALEAPSVAALPVPAEDPAAEASRRPGAEGGFEDAVEGCAGGALLDVSGFSLASTSALALTDQQMPSLALSAVAAAMSEDLTTRILRPCPEGSSAANRKVHVLPLSSQGLFDAAASGSVDELRQALATCEESDLERRHPLHGGTVLHVAAGHVASSTAAGLVAEICAHGADVSARAWNHSTPLHWAAGAGNDGAVEELLRHGADASLTSHTWGSNVFGKGSGQTATHWAAESGHEACIEVLVRESALAPFIVDERGQRPLDLAINEHHGGISALLEAAANVEMVCVAVSTEAHVHRVVQPLAGGADQP
eukprot:CAMPEP_0203976972 /NCGR_PEP_ID=MMETSP0359-20131031/101382_1 /ASSEMBLY_ACC=CAM_ASM_000338 /TAXON_ID=268821 /ORGANISM="Scrippsiella Hangoei, Strain SHTV-5" /LENGTH=428 /DNA_ID=CAMNT_0050915181 /DNA_START=11 /DNA_END=1297 /DNA_ORIENTATION=-